MGEGDIASGGGPDIARYEVLEDEGVIERGLD